MSERVVETDRGPAPSGEARTILSVPVRAGGVAADYEVRVARGSLRDLPALLRGIAPGRRWVVISDETVAQLYGGETVDRVRASGLDATLLEFPAGERHKTRETWAHLTDSMVEAGYGRDSAVVALGGGVTGDLAGFVAASFMRGVPVVQVPTSLVAMIDASIGGKTGVDTPAGKNLVGAFHPPRLVVIDPEAARTLPRGERAAGLAEALKHGAILDEPYLSELENDLPALLDGDPTATERAVFRSVQLKAGVVGGDEHESGRREILNFGHTLGHALEAASGFSLSHGAAVGLGMVLEAQLGEDLGVTEAGTSERLREAVEALGLISRVGSTAQAEKAISYLGVDKKRREGRLRCVILRRVGEVDVSEGWSRAIEVDDARTVLEDSGRMR
jgi:3-dehydroquinate synthase